MRAIIQITTAMFTTVDEEKDFDEQQYTLFALCDDSSIWQYNGNGWDKIDTSDVTKYLNPRDK